MAKDLITMASLIKVDDVPPKRTLVELVYGSKRSSLVEPLNWHTPAQGK